MANLTSITNNLNNTAIGTGISLDFTLDFDALVHAWGDINNQLYVTLNNGGYGYYLDTGVNDSNVQSVSFQYISPRGSPNTATGDDVAELRVTGFTYDDA